MRFSFMKPINPGALQTLVQLKSGAVNLWSLALTAGGQLQVQQQQALGLTTTTGPTVLEDNRWYTIRIVYDRAAGGLLRVFVFNAIDIDTTHSSAGSTVDAIDISGLPGPIEFYYDDFFVARSTAPLPIGQIVRRGPNGAGVSSGFDTPFPSGTRFQNVDEITPGGAGDADYNQHAASTVATDLYALQDSTPGPINAVKAMWRMQHSSGGGAGTHDYAWRESGVTSSAPFVGLGLTWQTTETIWSVPPSSGGSWTEAKLNGLELGAVHNGTLTEDTFLSWTTAMVDYRPVPRYRSIGTAGPHVAGSISVARGAYTVHGTVTGWKTANRGRGDRFTVGGVDYTVASVDSETRLTLREPFEGATISGTSYTVARQYRVLQTWSDCVTGTPASCTFFPVIGSDLIAENRSEVGIAYKDTTFTAGVQIDTALTDANHTITLTADDGNRHYGIPGGGVLIDNSLNVADAVRIRDDYVTVEWLEVSGGGDPATDAVHVTGQAPSAHHVVVRNMLLHDQPQYGIVTSNTDIIADLYNNILYGNDRGIQISTVLTANARVRILNNTVYDSAGARGIFATGGASPVLLRNNIAHTTPLGTDYDIPNLDPLSSHNLASDLSGIPHSPGTGGQNSVSLADVRFRNEPARDLHITAGSFAKDAGFDLSSIFSFDVDAGARKMDPMWDVGADDLAATTEVELVSFTARGLESAVLLEWETASELDNLGFHLYRSQAASGPFSRITERLIPGLGSSPSGASYRFRDDGLSNGVTYYYKLEDVESTGRTETHGPIAATPGETPDAGLPPAGGGTDATTLGITYGDPSRNAFRVLERGRRQIVLELLTEGLHAVPQEDGTVVITIPDFEPLSEEGTPSIPVKRPWVDIGEGQVADIVSVQASAAELLPAWPLAGGELAELSASRRGTVRLSRRRQPLVLSSSGEFPSEPARILDVGYQGERRRARIELAPLRWDRTTGRLLLTRRLVVQLALRPSRDAVRNGGKRGRAPARGVLARLATERAGLYAVGYEDLFPTRRGRSLSVRSLRLARLGETIPFHVEPDSDRLAPGSRLYFVSPGGAANPYGPEAVFELELAQGQIMETRVAAPWGEPVPFWWVRTEREENRYYQAGLVKAPDVWLWDVLLAPQTKSYPFQISELASAIESARLTVWAQGVSDAAAGLDHHLRVSLNGSFLGETEWNGKEAKELELEMPAALLREGENVLELENVGDTGAPYSMIMLNRFSILHPRRALAGGDASRGRPGRSGAAESPGAFVLDLTGEAPLWLVGTSGGFRVEAEHEYVVVDPMRVERPLVRTASRPWLSDARRGADYLAIAPRAFRQSLEPLLSHRRNEGLRVEFADVESIYAEFGFGEPRPEAIRDFIRYAYHHWSKPSPSYVLLAGDGTYDFKDYLGTGVGNQVPPYLTRTSYLWAPSDPTLAAVNGDDSLPDIAIGRLPAASAEELGHMVHKILDYERAPFWMRDPLVLVADDADVAGNFAANEDVLASSVLSGHDVTKLYLDRMTPAALRDAIRDAFDQGAGLVSYVGHGGIHLWADENVFHLSDVDALAPRATQTFVVTMNCLNGYFHFPYFDSLAEKLVKSPGKGAVAAFSPGGLSLDEPAHRFHQLLLHEVVNQPHTRLGDAVLAAQRAYAERGAFPELLSIYHLFGDPALRLR
jgi:hypothetical protein